MIDSNVFKLNKPDQNDLLQEMLREGARKMLAAAIESELTAFRSRLVRNMLFIIEYGF